MKKTSLLLLVAGLTSPASLYSATLAFEDFEDATIGYTTSIADDLSDIGARDYFGRIAPDTSTPPSTVSYSNPQGSGYYGAQDTNGVPSGGATTITIDFAGINITNFTNLNFSAFFAEDDDGANQDWDATSSVIVTYQIDGGGFTNLLAFEASIPSGFNTAPFRDNDFDSVGEGVELTDVFTQFSVPITGIGSTLDLRITIEALNDGDEDIAIDNVLITGDAPVPEPSSALLGGLALLFLLGRRR